MVIYATGNSRSRPCPGPGAILFHRSIPAGEIVGPVEADTAMTLPNRVAGP
jgi:hypothetical protein